MNRGEYRKLFDLSDRVVVVTGGLGILGRRFCAGFADYGAKVAVVDLDVEELAKFSDALEKEFETRCVGVATNITDAQSVKQMADAVERVLGPIDVLHNNAATKGHNLDRFFYPVEDYDMGTWREVMAVNLDGAFLVAKEIGTRMAERQRGSIIQTASIYGVMAPDQRIYEGSEYMGRPINTPPVYSASKAGIVGLTRYLATYWAGKNVRVNTLTPGGVSSGQNAVFEKRYTARVPMARMALAGELVGAAVFLASDASSYMTGQNIVVDGGLAAW